MIKKTVFAVILACTAFSAPVRADESEIIRKLNTVIANQDVMTEKLDAIQAELQIVKVRATQR